MRAEREIMIRGGSILEPETGAREADLLIRDGRIAEVGNLVSHSAEDEIDAGGTYIVPGLVNAHMHSGENFNPGLYENLPLDVWFVRSHQVTRKDPPAPEVIYDRTMLGAMQMLRTGTTAAVDFLFEAPEITLQTLEPVIAAYRDAGLRASVLLGVSDLPYRDSLPLDEAEREIWEDEAEAPSLERILEVARAAVKRWHRPEDGIVIGMGPSAPQRCSPELLERSLDLCREHDLPWQTHVLETKSQVWTARERHGHSFIAELERRGQLGPDTTLVHTVWLEDSDIEAMARTGAPSVHCLASNMRLGDGIAPVPALRRAGVRVGLGTDGRGCDETMDMLELARWTAQTHKARGGDHEQWLTARDAFCMLTRDGGSLAGHGESLGRLEIGAPADLLMVEAGGIAFTPLHDPVRQLIFGAGPEDIRSVVVGGRTVVDGGRLVHVDETERIASARASAAGEAEILGLQDSSATKLDRIVESAYTRIEATDTPGVDAYIPN